jgi:GT2 family glycosyltransferase
MQSAPHCTAVVLNWNGWRDTVACLESLLQAQPAPRRIVVCDNGSADDSVARIEAWMQGADAARFTRLSREQCERGGSLQGLDSEPDGVHLVLVLNGANLGFAGGMNVGLRLALQDTGCRHVWMLNNDTLVAPDALYEGLARMAGDPAIGICGATLVYAHDRRTVQAFGGSAYSAWTGRTWHLGAMRTLTDVPLDPAPVEARMACVVGAAMLVRREVFESVGLLTEDYFLYFEEIDWARRAAGRFRLGYAPRSLVFHKEGASIGTAAGGGSPLSLYYLFRNRVRFSWRFHRGHLPWVLASTLLDVAKLAVRARWPQARAALRGTLQLARA